MLLTWSRRFKPWTKDNLKHRQLKLRPVFFSKEDVVALKHNWKRYLEPLFLAILREDPHRNNVDTLEITMHLNWLESRSWKIFSFTLSVMRMKSTKARSSAWKTWLKGSNKSDTESSDAEGSDMITVKTMMTNRHAFSEAGRSRSGRRVTRYVV